MSIIMAIVVATQGKRMYIEQGLKKIKVLIAENTPEDEIIKTLQSTGGTSTLAGVIGVIPTVLGIAYAILVIMASWSQ